MTYRCILKDRLKAAGLSQNQLAMRIGMSSSAISRLTKQNRSGSIETWLEIARILGCTVDDLFVKNDVFRYKEV